MFWSERPGEGEKNQKRVMHQKKKKKWVHANKDKLEPEPEWNQNTGGKQNRFEASTWTVEHSAKTGPN